MLNLSALVSSLDPAVQESVKIINYFDALLSEQVGVDGLLRAATLLSGCATGVKSTAGKLIRRVDADGDVQFHSGALESGWQVARSGSTAQVWIERSEGENANDLMVLERLALVMEITLERRKHRRRRALIEVLLDPTASTSDKNAAVVDAGLSPEIKLRVVASPALIHQDAVLYESVFPTDSGLLRATIIRGDSIVGPAGVGTAESPFEFHRSWRAAVSALKLSTEEHPVVDASGLGILLQLQDLSPSDPDLSALLKANDEYPWIISTLSAIVGTNSLRAAATELNLHHSTVQSRISTFIKVLEFDPLSPLGRARAAVLLAIWKLHTTKF